jgi:hypothetical protein
MNQKRVAQELIRLAKMVEGGKFYTNPKDMLRRIDKAIDWVGGSGRGADGLTSNQAEYAGWLAEALADNDKADIRKSWSKIRRDPPEFDDILLLPSILYWAGLEDEAYEFF